MSTRRITLLRGILLEKNWQAIVISHPQNRRYLSGFTGSSGHLLITHDLALLLTDFRYVERALQEAPQFEVVQERDNLDSKLAHLFEQHSLKSVAFESDYITVAQLGKWQEIAPDIHWIPAENIVESLRAVKEKSEIETIRQAVQLTDETFTYLTHIIRPQMSERQVAWELEKYIRTHHAEKVAFDLIVGSGPNGAMPHASASEREIQPGEPIVLDMGAVIDGYHSDMTRTICLGQPDERFDQIYNTVLAAQKAAEEAISPGMTAQDADSIAREAIKQAGFGENFGHSLGHGVGLAIHEAPYLRQKSTEVLKPGMVVTVEPGIYLSGWGGVRIEDMVVITENGCEVLTGSSKNPFISIS